MAIATRWNGYKAHLEGKRYSWCHKFATVVIVGENTHVVGVCPLGEYGLRCDGRLSRQG